MENSEFHTVRGYQLIEQEKKLLTSAMEDYLEMIFRNIKKEGYMRINTLAEMLNVRPSSATKMVQKLSEKGFVEYKRYGIIILTEKGKALGEFLLKRHNIIEKFLRSIGISDNLLIETELIEHNLSVDTLRSIDELNSFFEEYPEILEKFRRYKNKKAKK